MNEHVHKGRLQSIPVENVNNNVLPLIYILEQAAGSVRGGEDALVWWDSWGWTGNRKKVFKFSLKIVFSTLQKRKI